MTAGLLLAAGQGNRFGMPKALATHRGAALVTRAADALLDGGCDPVVVVLGARATEARPLVPGRARAG
ncbi:NTP transferase domain-containing protein, partial [Prauserella alba]|uniref:NTP transferase domain-containing protein n=1 Tax=Prauserella alba TaxID=176898 RepID=UPI0031D6F0A3